ncbi:MAG: (Glutamate--ammonia-ligase) adenylyltransferase [Acidobacteriaceae bacterium]|nr:(Glutamate--ammonia-ligase) adenylyltransferase [Acidobacteriaceae bacterium]
MQSSEKPGDLRDHLESIPFQALEAARQQLASVCSRLSPSLATALPGLLAETPDPDSALLLFDRLLSGDSSETLRLIESHPFLAHYAIAVFGNSRYVGETLVRNTDLLQTFLRERKLDRSLSHEEFSEALARFRSRSFERDVSLLLSRFKRREYVRIMLRDVLRISPLAETTGEISALSDVLIQDALREAESSMELRYGLPQHLDAEGRALTTPFAVLSLGKLGGSELNYSSDIDLLYLYGDGQEPVTAPISNREYFVRLAQQLTEILSRPTAEGAVFRIDLRLRPQGNEGELAISLSNALRYYSETAHDWERQALIKVRHSAGNIPLARRFVRGVQSQVYSEKVNFVAIKTALVAREKIDRKRRKQVAAEGESINVKVDRGGIRDIEFLVQCLQRVYGGAEPWLRSGGTLFSLQKLHDKRHISGHDFHELTSAYSFLRHLEHRLQLREGQQVHRLPRSEHELQILQRSMAGLTPGYSLADLRSSVRQRMAAVAEIYQRVIYQQQANTPQQEKEGEFQLQTLSGIATAEQSNQQLLEKLARDAPELFQAISGLSPVGRKNLIRFLSSAYASSERYAAVVRDQQAIARASSLFEVSDHLSESLARYPEEVSTLAEIYAMAAQFLGANLFDVSAGGFRDSPFESSDATFDYIANSTTGHAEKIALLRRHFRHLIFASGVRDVAEHRSVYSSLAQTTAAAEHAISAAFRIAGSPRGLAVLALGRLGTREFDLLSDADLLFVCDGSQNREALTKSAEQIMQALAAYTQEGMVFPVDARLRPRGAEGELAVSTAHLESYFATDAQPWEALTYTKLRLIAGSTDLGRQASQISESLFKRFAADSGFPRAVREMRTKLQDATAPAKSIRTSAGGLYDIDFLSSFLLVKNGVRPKSGTLRDRLWRCSSAGVLDKHEAAILDHAGELYRTVEHILRLVTGRNGRWLPSAEHPRHSVETLTSQILRREFPEGLEQELLRTFAEVRSIYDRVVI